MVWARQGAAAAWGIAQEHPKGLGPQIEENSRLVSAYAPILASTGPRIGWAAWIPAAGIHQPSEWLLVASVKDEAAFDLACLRARGMFPENVKDYTARDLPRVGFALMAGNDIAVARGNGWAAFGTPAKVREAARRGAGEVSDSLQSQKAYRRALVGLPTDAAVTQYVSGALLKQAMEPFVALRPGATEPPPSDGVAWAMSIRVEPRSGRRMLVADWVMDFDSSILLLDAPAAASGLPAAIEYKANGVAEAACRNHMTVLAKAMQQYTQGHEGRLPPADRWVEELSGYASDASIFKCPKDTSGAKSSYGMNLALSGKALPEGADPKRVVVLYETVTPGDNPAGDRSNQASRHGDETVCVTADGSVVSAQGDLEWLSPDGTGK